MSLAIKSSYILLKTSFDLSKLILDMYLLCLMYHLEEKLCLLTEIDECLERLKTYYHKNPEFKLVERFPLGDVLFESAETNPLVRFYSKPIYLAEF